MTILSTLSDNKANAIIEYLWQSDVDGNLPNVFAVLDCAKDRRIEPMINNCRLEHKCLYLNTKRYELKRAAPHIVKLERDHLFVTELLQKGWGQSWGIFFIAPNNITLSTFASQCRRIAKVKSGKKTFVFRYYDPRILRVYLPTCNRFELKHLIGSSYAIVTENSYTTGVERFECDKSAEELSIYDAEFETVPPENKASLKNTVRDKRHPLSLEGGPSPDGALHIRPEQMNEFDKIKEEAFFITIYQCFIDTYVDDNTKKCFMGGKEVPLKTLIQQGFHSATEFGLKTQYGILEFIGFCYDRGWGFWNEKDNAWAKTLLEKDRQDIAKIEGLTRGFLQKTMDEMLE